MLIHTALARSPANPRICESTAEHDLCAHSTSRNSTPTQSIHVTSMLCPHSVLEAASELTSEGMLPLKLPHLRIFAGCAGQSPPKLTTRPITPTHHSPRGANPSSPIISHHLPSSPHYRSHSHSRSMGQRCMRHLGRPAQPRADRRPRWPLSRGRRTRPVTRHQARRPRRRRRQVAGR
jgi:hypothetical protein